ncbi:MAG: hypothetical protein ACRES7_06330 [Gammaproteobacteria bacterium]
MNRASTLVRRELWEHRGPFLILPIVLFGLVTLACLILGIIVGGGFTDIHPSGSADPAGIIQLGLGISAAFFTPYAIMLLFFLPHSLQQDRQDKSVLFWRSLPVTDTATVAAKVAMAGLLGAFLLWIAIIAAHLIVLFALACAASARGAAGFSVFTSPVALLGSWGLIAWSFIVQALWWLPYYGWLLFCSAATRRFALLWAVLPLLIIGFFEMIVLRSTYFFNFVGSHLGFSPIFPNGGIGVNTTTAFTDNANSLGAGTLWVTHFLALPSMWIGVGIGLVLLVLAVIARRYSATA